MNEDRFDELMRDAERTYRTPPTPDFDAMWKSIERERRIRHTRPAVWSDRRQILVAPCDVGRHLMQEQVDLAFAAAAGERLLDEIRRFRRYRDRAPEQRAEPRVQIAQIELQDRTDAGDRERAAHRVLRSRRFKYASRLNDRSGALGARGGGAGGGTATTSIRPM